MSYEREFLEAVKRGDPTEVMNLLRERPDLVRFAGEHGKTGLHWAAELDRVEVARILLDAGADIEAATSWGATPLDWAAVMGSAAVADLLVARGATGFTLIAAASLGKLEAVRAIIQSGQDLRTQRRRGGSGSPDDEWPADSAYMQGDRPNRAL